VYLKAVFAVVAFEARFVVSNTISRELIHQIHGLVTSLAFLLGPRKRHRSVDFFPSLLLINRSKTPLFLSPTTSLLLSLSTRFSL